MTTERGSPRPRQNGGEGSGDPAAAGRQLRPPNHVAILKLEFTIPPDVWYGQFTRRHPELVVKATNIISVAGDDTLGEFEIYGPPVDWTNEIARYPNVIDVESLEVLPDLGRYRVRYCQSPLIPLATRLEVLIRYPSIVKNGILECELFAGRLEIYRVVNALAKAGGEPRLLSLRPGPLRPVTQASVVVLTPVQRALFHQALTSGYYEVPRRVTLTQLAERVYRNKSSVSKTLARVERELAKFASAAGA